MTGESIRLWETEWRPQSQGAECPTKDQGHWGHSQSGTGQAPMMGTFLKLRTGSCRKLWALGLCWSKQALSPQSTKHSLSRVEGPLFPEGPARPESLTPLPRSAFSGQGRWASTGCGSWELLLQRVHKQPGCAAPGRGLEGRWLAWVYLAYGSHDTLGNKCSHFLSEGCLG